MRLISFIVVMLFLASCNKDKPTGPTIPVQMNNGMVVLCEGLFQQNNSTISWVGYGTSSIENDFFYQVAERNLGDTGNEIYRYGGKVYVVVNVSSTVEVLNASDFSPLKQIEMIDNNVAKQPRSVIGYGSSVYVTCYDGFVDMIDTSSLNIVARIPVGPNPEGLAISNDKLYVANSGGLNYPNVDSTVSVVDLATNTELLKLTVGLNPGDLEVDDDGDVYVISRGDYGSVPSRMHRIDPTTDQVVNNFAFDASEISPFNSNQFLISYADFSSGANNIALFDASSETIMNSSFIDMSEVQTVYEVSYNPFNNKIYLCDALNFSTTGYVREYSSSGTYLQSFHVGLNPTKILFYE